MFNNNRFNYNNSEDKAFGKLNKKIASRYEEVTKVFQGVSRVKLKNGLYTFVSEEGVEFEDKYLKADNFYFPNVNGYNSVTRVNLKDGLWCYINQKGKKISNEYAQLGAFKKGVAIAKDESGSWTFLDCDMREFGGKFLKVERFTTNNLAIVQDKNEKFYLMDKDIGLIKREYDEIIRNENKGYLAFSKKTKIKLDKKGNVIHFVNNYKQMPKNLKLFSLIDTMCSTEKNIEITQYFYKNKNLKKIVKFLKYNPHLVGELEPSYFVDKEYRDLILKTVSRKIKKIESSEEQVTPVYCNKEYVNVIVDKIKYAIETKEKEYEKEINDSYSQATAENVVNR
jgi:hypothetical protein